MKPSIVAIAMGLLLSVTGYSQSTPVPAPFASAKTVFLANGGAAGARQFEQSAIENVVYESMFAALAQSRYRAVNDPNNADLAMVVSIEGTSSANIYLFSYLRLNIYDTKTHVLLWSLDEPINGFSSEKTWRKTADKATALALRDLNLLAQGVLPGSSAPKPSNASANKDSK